MTVTEKDIRDALKTVKDPELNLDLVVLGLVYDIDINDSDVHVMISLTSPMCPVADQIVSDAQTAVAGGEGVENCEVNITFDPPWSQDLMSDEAKLELGLL